MNITTIKVAEREAKRFLAAAKATEAVATPGGQVWGSKESGALRRASMDLTRALAEMRKPS